MPGPVPNREEDRARPRSRKGGEQREVTKGTMRTVEIPEADFDWHPAALKIWLGLKASGQSDFFQQSDWAFAHSLMDDLTYYKRSGRRSPEMLKAIMSGLSNLLVTEADRRRVRIELQQPEDEGEPAAVLAIADYRAALDADVETPEDEDDDAS